MKQLRIPLRTVFYQEGGRWIAHCLEFDLLGDGDTRQEAIHDLSEAISVQLEFSMKEGNIDNLFSPADSKFFRMFAEGTKSDVTTVELLIKIDSVEIDEVEAREYSGPDLVPA